MLCRPFTGPSGSPETRRDPHDLGEPGYFVGALQRPGCVCEEEGPAVCGRPARCESQPAALRDSKTDSRT